MAKLTVDGKEIPQVLQAEVLIHHGDSRDPLLAPLAEFCITTRITSETLLADWAKAAKGKERFKKVELQMQNRDGVTQHTWTILHGWVRSYSEAEWRSQLTAGGGGVEEQLTGYDVRLIIRGALPGNVDYDGKNVVDVAAGEAGEH